MKVEIPAGYQLVRLPPTKEQERREQMGRDKFKPVLNCECGAGGESLVHKYTCPAYGTIQQRERRERIRREKDSTL